MFRTPQKRGGAANLFSSPHRTPMKSVPLKGLFADGIWMCNCEPRLPASHFQVKKEGRNQGRWFYTCQQPKDNGCGFFLWDDDAGGREMRAVINNSRTEPDELRTRADSTGEKKAAEPSSGKNWIQNLGKADEDEFGEFPLSAQDVEEVALKAEQQRPQPPPYPVTPRKAVKTDTFVTPGSKRKRGEDTLLTPISGGIKDENLFTSSSTGRLKGHMWDGNEPFGLRSPSATPTPSRFRDAVEGLELSAEKTKQGYDITEEVMGLLKDQHIDDETWSILKELLSKYAMKISGIAKGRDITRIALKAKDAKIAELQQKITALETEREMDKTIIRHFKSDMAQSIISKRGRGRGRT